MEPHPDVRMEHPLWDVATTVRMAVHVCIDGGGRLWLQMASPSGRTWITPGLDHTWWFYRIDGFARQWVQFIPGPSTPPEGSTEQQ